MKEFLTSNPFWLFLGIVSGALIQYFLGWLERHRQARTALKVLQIEVRRNLELADLYIQHIVEQCQLVSAQEREANEVYFPTQSFDYSAMGPLNNSGYLHILLGPQVLSDLLRFNSHFNNRNADLLHDYLVQSARHGSATTFLQDEIKRAKDYRKSLVKLLAAKKRFLRFGLKYPKDSWWC
ncbi:hypothetical protein [Roseovarius litoreus]|uniref:hypothetical protein n=1 Tax=Roseovarius litoreus TaxID=1155722 RepID=UPI00122C72A6|nr:hypothetical protein [Roseovarius litoreus]